MIFTEVAKKNQIKINIITKQNVSRIKYELNEGSDKIDAVLSIKIDNLSDLDSLSDLDLEINEKMCIQ